MNNIIFKTALIKGEAGNNIQSIEKTATSGAVDTYTITLTDGSTTTFNVTNGSNIASITLTGSSGLVDTYTVTLTDGSTTTFDVRNGQDYTVPTNGMIYYDDDNALPEGYEVAGNFTDEILAGEASGNVASFIGLDNTIVKELVVTIEPVQAGSGTPSPINERAISGFTSCIVTNCGKNMFNNNYADYAKPTDYMICPIKLKQGQKYTLSATLSGTATTGMIVGIVKDGTRYSDFIGLQFVIDIQGNTSFKYFTVDETWTNPKLVIYANNETAFNNIFGNYNIQLEQSETATTYEPYTTDTAEISFTGAGTIYGGKLDFNTGKLTVDKVTVNVESLSLRSGGSLTNGTKSTCCQFNLPSSQYATITAYNVRKGAIGNKGTETDPYYAYQLSAGVNTFENCEFALMTNGQYITVYLPDATITTTEDFITALGNYQICYPLATPIEITSLTADDLHTLEGINNVTASTGAIEKIVYFKSSIIADIYERLLALE